MNVHFSLELMESRVSFVFVFVVSLAYLLGNVLNISCPCFLT